MTNKFYPLQADPVEEARPAKGRDMDITAVVDALKEARAERARQTFTPIRTDRAEKVDTAAEPTADPEPARKMIWAYSKAESELMSAMTDEELDAYLEERDKVPRYILMKQGGLYGKEKTKQEHNES